MRERTEIADPLTDQLEELWWNQNAQAVEAIWAQPYAIRMAVRSHYMACAKQFFLECKSDRPIQVLEVGCGSGWVGRMIADPDAIKIVGIDLSEQQITLARDNAAKDGLSDVCEYHCENLADFAVNKSSDISCVLIHAILHHLSWQEIHSIFNQIISLGSGTRIVIYEPVYLRKDSGKSGLAAQVLYVWSSILANTPKILGKLLVLRHSKDLNQVLKEKVETIVQESTEKGWVLSPKEVVFQEEELLQLLSRYCLVDKSYLCNQTSVGTGQMAAFYNSSYLHNLFSKTILPISLWVDRYLYKVGMTTRVTNGYVFMGYECTVK